MSLKSFKFWALFIPICIIFLGVLGFFLVPPFAAWVVSVLQSTTGILIFMGAMALLALFYYLLGFRGEEYTYIMMVVIFVFACIVTLINFDSIIDWLDATIGTWGTIGVMVLFGLFIWFLVRFLL